ncbi:hypothetical protein [Undibacterium sp. TC9W]|uniref:hypothetical protein n=1 Tax=Undibacterium sp. TC9W TaxID=3413053 RepID=UPI003BF3914C
MHTLSTRDHLRLVSDSSRKNQTVKPVNGQSEQLTFSFSETSEMTFVREIDILRTNEFSFIIENIKPRWLFDVRITPRLDFVASSRAKAFKLFEQCQIDYVDIMGAIGVETYNKEESFPEYWGTLVTSILKEAEIARGPYVFIFDNETILRRSQYVLPPLMMNMANLSELRTSIYRSSELK